jgi:BirA family biotin operon repressor/biotin-[acetyl-CoA-carboxylase] ligase
VTTALETEYGLESKIKWPNDVLVGGRKLSGVLVETDWQGEELTAIVIGIGINVARESEPLVTDLLFPATSVETALKNFPDHSKPVNRWDLLRSVIESLLEWLPRLERPEFLQAWEDRLAFRGELVSILQAGEKTLEGQLFGLAEDGGLILRLPSDEDVVVRAGEIHLRPANVDRQEK